MGRRMQAWKYFRIEGLDDLVDALARAGEVQRPISRALEAAADELAKHAKRRAPGPHIYSDDVREWRYRRFRIQVGPDKEHWWYRWYEYGAKPHPITPRRRKWLRFRARDGRVVFTKYVFHPGIPKRPFLRPALDEHAADIVAAADRELRRWLERLGR